MVLSSAELSDLQDRLFQLRCAAEDVVSAAEDGVDHAELSRMAAQVLSVAGELERIR